MAIEVCVSSSASVVVYGQTVSLGLWDTADSLMCVHSTKLTLHIVYHGYLIYKNFAIVLLSELHKRTLDCFIDEEAPLNIPNISSATMTMHTIYRITDLPATVS
ncbi:hypothetical protein Scep_005098 [Stephania cephalantha]|uniref:Uncharacterized protein n=1 Tax=Stephania cephalantha TaxID=152367 RepID=A0AAP0KV98_9MAGN